MSDSPPPPKRVRLSDDDLGSMSKQELIDKLREFDSYIEFLEERQRLTETGDDSDELKGKLDLARRKENTLVARLANKEQEVQECLTKIQELKHHQSSSYSSAGQLRKMQLDPAVNLVFVAMQKAMDALKEKLELSQNDISAWKFTPDSQTGKKLMSKCSMLHQENEELGKVLSSGRIAKLEGEVALEKALVTEMKKGQSDLDEFLSEIDEDVEGMQGMVYVLQQQLKDTKLQLDAALACIDDTASTTDEWSGKPATDLANSTDAVSSRMLNADTECSTNNPAPTNFPGRHNHKPTLENHVDNRAIDAAMKSSEAAAKVKVEPMEVDSSDQWTTRTSGSGDTPPLANNAHSPSCNTSSTTDQSSRHKPNTTTTAAEHRTSAPAATRPPATSNEVSASGDAKVKLKVKVEDIRREPSTTQNGASKRTISFDALDE